MTEKVSINIAGNPLDLDTVVGSEGERGIAIKPVRGTTGHIMLDPGYGNTGSCTSDITYIDGENGILRYRGYPIEQLAAGSTFTEVSYLLTEGRLPSSSELEDWDQQLTIHSLLHEDIKRMFMAFPPNAHPMAILSAVVCALSTFYPDSQDPVNPDDVRMSTIRLLAKLPTIAAFSYKQSRGEAYMYPENALSYSARLLKMMFGYRTEPFVINEENVRVLDQLLVLHADHEQNCSTSTVRAVGSARANLYACISAGICALWGPLHGGANQRVIEMLELILKDGGDVGKYVNLARDKSSGFRLMGFGHRVYKSYDPRATILRESCEKVLANMQKNDPLLNVARKLEEVALNDSYFKERNLYPNVDFYSGIIYRALNIPTNMFTAMFALGRLPGWIAQWKENLAHGYPITRPRQIYTGPGEREYQPVDQR
jgi:citrate synthase